MQYLEPLFETVRQRVKPPVCIAMGPAKPIAGLVAALCSQGPVDITAFQMDLYAADKLKAILAERELTATVEAAPDLWDLPARFNTVIMPAPAHTDRELKIDLVDQGYHLLQPGGTFITLSEYHGDTQMAKLHKKIFGKCGETPATDNGMAFFSTKTDADRPRRRHEIEFHAKLGDSPPMTFLSRPGTFSYGRFDDGSRALLEVAEIQPDEHVLDLGCGNGAVGCLASTKSGRGGMTTFIDSHLRAVQLAEMNAKANSVPNTTVIANATMAGLKPSGYDVILANPPYYGDSVVSRLFIGSARDHLKPGGRFYIVTKMPTAVVPQIFESFGECDVIENRGYSIVTATS
jgi:16S rRNA (guanine1207-N2)-methyltransferase